MLQVHCLSLKFSIFRVIFEICCYFSGRNFFDQKIMPQPTDLLTSQLNVTGYETVADIQF